MKKFTSLRCAVVFGVGIFILFTIFVCIKINKMSKEGRLYDLAVANLENSKVSIENASIENIEIVNSGKKNVKNLSDGKSSIVKQLFYFKYTVFVHGRGENGEVHNSLPQQIMPVVLQYKLPFPVDCDDM